MTHLPFRPERSVIKPTQIKGMQNGRLADDVLKPCGIRSFVMVEPAARAMREMRNLAWAQGIRLSATGTYRTYKAQVALFERRYQNTPSYPGARHEVWNGKDWWLRKGVAGAAVPGTSNHGWALAVDFARRNKAGKLVVLDGVTLEWLADHGPKYGYYNTVQSENWHWCYVLGDKLPPALT